MQSKRNNKRRTAPKRRQRRPRGRKLNRRNNNISTMSVRRGPDAPVARSTQVTNRASRQFVIRHSELLLGKLTGSVDYVANQITVNPGLIQYFPWLANLARLYEKYTVESMVFKYVPLCNTTQTGSVLFQFDFDPTDPTPSDYNIFMMNEPAISNTSWKGFQMAVPRKYLASRQNLYVRYDDVPSGSDPKLYDLGNFNFGTIGNANDGDVLGSVFVEYEICFSQPTSYAPNSVGFIEVANGTGQDHVNVFGTDPVAIQGLYPPIDMFSSDSIYFVAGGTYLVTWELRGTGVTGNGMSLSVASGATINVQGNIVNGAGTAAIYYAFIEDASGQDHNPTTVHFSSTATTVTLARVTVAPVDPNFVPQ